MTTKTVFLLNYASYYRKNIFKRLSNNLGYEFYFSGLKSNIKKLDYDELLNFKAELPVIRLGSFSWYVGSVSLLFKPYKNYVLTGDPHIISNWFILLGAVVLNKRVFLWTHGWYGDEVGLKRLVKLLYFKLAYKVFLYGKYSRDKMILEGFSEDRLVTVYNSLDYDEQLKIRTSLTKDRFLQERFGNKYPIIVFIGRVIRGKKLELILDCMVKLRNDGFYVNFIVIGKEEAGYDFNSEVRKRNLNEEVWMYGPCYDEKMIGRLLFNSDVCISPGYVGLTGIHSLTYGTPVITHDDFSDQAPEFEVIQEGYNGAFFAKGDVDDLSRKVQFILNLNLPKGNCYELIDTVWNPSNQITIFSRHIG